MPPKARKAAAKPAAKWITCVGYTLKMDGKETKFEFDIFSAGGEHAFLQPGDGDEDRDLVKKVLDVLHEAWPTLDIQFQFDDSKKLTDIRTTPKSRGRDR